MPLKMEPLEEPTLNLTPMIDIVLLLVIFFMVGTQFTENESQFEIELPEAVAAQPLSGGPDAMTIEVQKSGTTTLDGTPVSDAQLKAELTAARAQFKNQAVVIRGDRAINFQRIMTVISLVEQTELTNIQLAFRVNDDD